MGHLLGEEVPEPWPCNMLPMEAYHLLASDANGSALLSEGLVILREVHRITDPGVVAYCCEAWREMDRVIRAHVKTTSGGGV